MAYNLSYTLGKELQNNGINPLDFKKLNSEEVAKELLKLVQNKSFPTTLDADEIAIAARAATTPEEILQIAKKLVTLKQLGGDTYVPFTKNPEIRNTRKMIFDSPEVSSMIIDKALAFNKIRSSFEAWYEEHNFEIVWNNTTTKESLELILNNLDVFKDANFGRFEIATFLESANDVVATGVIKALKERNSDKSQPSINADDVLEIIRKLDLRSLTSDNFSQKWKEAETSIKEAATHKKAEAENDQKISALLNETTLDEWEKHSLTQAFPSPDGLAAVIPLITNSGFANQETMANLILTNPDNLECIRHLVECRTTSLSLLSDDGIMTLALGMHNLQSLKEITNAYGKTALLGKSKAVEAAPAAAVPTVKDLERQRA